MLRKVAILSLSKCHFSSWPSAVSTPVGIYVFRTGVQFSSLAVNPPLFSLDTPVLFHALRAGFCFVCCSLFTNFNLVHYSG